MAGTRRVKMIVGVSGERHDGRKWPPMFGEIDVPGWEADDLIRGQNAVEAGAAAEPEPAPDVQVEAVASSEIAEAVAPAEITVQVGVTGPGEDGAAGPPAEPDAVQPAPVVAPPPSAPKQAWIDYAIQACDADPAEAGAMTKADLMSRYGGRL